MRSWCGRSTILSKQGASRETHYRTRRRAENARAGSKRAAGGSKTMELSCVQTNMAGSAIRGRFGCAFFRPCPSFLPLKQLLLPADTNPPSSPTTTSTAPCPEDNSVKETTGRHEHPSRPRASAPPRPSPGRRWSMVMIEADRKINKFTPRTDHRFFTR